MANRKHFMATGSVRLGSVLTIVLAAWLSGSCADAQIVWSGAFSNDWGVSSNWVGGAPSSAAVAEFTSAFAAQPKLVSASGAIDGIWVTGTTHTTGRGGVTTIYGGGAFDLAILGSGTIDGIKNVGILLDGSGNNSLTIDSSVQALTLSNPTSFLVNNAGNLSIAAPICLNSNTLTLGSTTASASGCIAISGIISGAGGITVSDTAGATSVLLTGANTYTGMTSITGGTLQLGTGGSLPGSGTVYTGPTGTFDLNGVSQILASVVDNGTITNSSATAATLTTGNGSGGSGGSYTGNLNVVVSVTGSTGTPSFPASFNNNGTITNCGTGTVPVTLCGSIGSNVTGIVENSAASILKLSGSYGSFGGNLIVQSGTVNEASGGTFGTPGSRITLGSSGNTNAVLLEATLNASTTFAASQIVLAGSDSGPITLAVVGGGAQATVSGAISLNGDNLTVMNGAAGSLQLNGSVTGSGSLVFTACDGGNIACSGLINNSGQITNSGTGTGSLVLSGGVGCNVTELVQNSVSSPLILNGSSGAYAGGMTVRSGTLVIGGSINGSVNLSGSAAALAVTGTLGGNVTGGGSAVLLSGGGLIGGSVDLNGQGTICPGNNQTTATLTIGGSLTLNTGDKFVVDLNGTSCDSLIIDGDLTVNGGTLLFQSLNGSVFPGDYVIARYTGPAVEGGFTLSGLPQGWTVDPAVPVPDVPNAYEMVLLAVPEPHTDVMLIGGFAVLVGARRFAKISPPTRVRHPRRFRICSGWL